MDLLPFLLSAMFLVVLSENYDQQPHELSDYSVPFNAYYPPLAEYEDDDGVYMVYRIKRFALINDQGYSSTHHPPGYYQKKGPKYFAPNNYYSLEAPENNAVAGFYIIPYTTDSYSDDLNEDSSYYSAAGFFQPEPNYYSSVAPSYTTSNDQTYYQPQANYYNIPVTYYTRYAAAFATPVYYEDESSSHPMVNSPSADYSATAKYYFQSSHEREASYATDDYYTEESQYIAENTADQEYNPASYYSETYYTSTYATSSYATNPYYHSTTYVTPNYYSTESYYISPVSVYSTTFATTSYTTTFATPVYYSAETYYSTPAPSYHTTTYLPTSYATEPYSSSTTYYSTETSYKTTTFAPSSY